MTSTSRSIAAARQDGGESIAIRMLAAKSGAALGLVDLRLSRTPSDQHDVGRNPPVQKGIVVGIHDLNEIKSSRIAETAARRAVSRADPDDSHLAVCKRPPPRFTI